MKPIHGQAQSLCEKHGLKPVPPIDCEFKLGDRVIFTNDQDVKFEQIIIGFSSNDDFYGRFIHAIGINGTWDGCAGWFPHHPSQLERI